MPSCVAGVGFSLPGVKNLSSLDSAFSVSSTSSDTKNDTKGVHTSHDMDPATRGLGIVADQEANVRENSASSRGVNPQPLPFSLRTCKPGKDLREENLQSKMTRVKLAPSAP